jgi:cell wall-associated NlpC family hydrolase
VAALPSTPLGADRASAAPGNQAAPLLDVALAYRGVPYRWGGASRDGLDCSGLVVRAALDLGRRLPHSAAELFRFGDPVTGDDLQPGDLVFFANTYKRGISHVGISEGGSRFLAASSAAGKVTVGDLNWPYYRDQYAGARRLSFGARVAQAAQRLNSAAGTALTAPFRLGPAV